MLERRSRKPDRSVILLVLIVLVIVASGTYAYLQPQGPSAVDFPSTFTNEFLPKK